MKHKPDCWCEKCFNRGAELGDKARKAKKIDPVGHAQAADNESIEVWFEFYQEPICKV